MAASEVGPYSPAVFTNGTFGAQVSVVMATLQANAEQQAIAERPLKVPDISVFGVGRIINIKA
jgi:hypothetical protein